VAERPRARPRLLVLGAGPAQLGLLESLRERGDVDVIAVDRDPGAVGFPLATERAVLSSEDEEGIDRLARARGVAGIVSPGADWPVGIAARVAERLGLPHPIDARTGALVISKARQREAFAAAGVPHARALDPLDGALPLPCVVKAPDRQGQRGLTLVRSREELSSALAEARRASRSGGVLVEELVDGPEVTVSAVSLGGRFVPLTVTDRLTAAPPAFGVALAHVWPSSRKTGAAVDVARVAVESLGIRNGPSYTQLLLGPAGPVVMEVAARLGGGHDAELCEAATGVDLNALAIRAALGEPVSERDVTSCQARSHGRAGHGAAVVFLVAPPGTVEAVDGVAEAEAGEGVRWVRVYRKPGDVGGELRRGADRAGAVLATGPSATAALERARRAADAVRFRIDADAP
jgi:biotin carboxylase